MAVVGGTNETTAAGGGEGIAPDPESGTRTETGSTVPRRLRVWLGRRKWALAAAVAFVAVGLSYSFGYTPIVQHSWGWNYPQDIWVTYRGGQYAAWGDFTDGVPYVSAPAAGLLLTPAAMVADHFNLISSFPPIFLPKPTTWLVLGPYELVISTTVIFAADLVAEQLGVSTGRRRLLVWLEAAALVPVVLYGHPEDVVSVSFALWGLNAGMHGRWRRAGWLFGVAVVLQPLALLVLLPTLALTAPRVWWSVCWRGAAPTVLVMAFPLLTAWSQTLRFLREPNYIYPNHPTPLLGLTTSAGHNLVNAGPFRMVAVVLAAGVGWIAYRRRASAAEVVWWIGMALSLRVVLEPVLDVYYSWPAVAVLLVTVVAMRGWTRWCSITLLAALTVHVFWKVSPWAYWTPLVLALAVVLVLSGRQLPTPRPAACPSDAAADPGGAAAEPASR